MQDYLTLGTTPCGEDCAQVGSEGYLERTKQEADRYIVLLRKQFGVEPEGASLALKSFPHDFGTYHEVVCYFDPNIPEATDYAFNIENNLPEYWEEETST